MRSADDDTGRAIERAQIGFPADISPRRVVFGFDGYVDRVREVVADRHDAETYDRLATLAALGERIDRSVAQGSSVTFEWHQTGARTGGHAPHLSRIFDAWNFDPVMVGTFGDPEREVFATEFADCERHTLGEPGFTDAVEFDDGKLMLSTIGDSMTLDWTAIESQVGRDVLADRLDGAAVLGMGYWSETPTFPEICRGVRDLLADLSDPPDLVLIDTGDVRKLDDDSLRGGTDAIAGLADVARVAVSANRAETRRIATALAADACDPERDARVAYEAFGPALFVSHGTDRSIGISRSGAESVAVPRVEEPVLTTSSGDHFNAGLALALLEGLGPAPALVVGNAVAREFVRTGTAPSLPDVRSAIESYESAF